jgi:uncharacterized protein YecE (DUF72 family)
VQSPLFPQDESGRKRSGRGSSGVEAATVPEALCELGRRLPSNFRVGTSSWSYPGWIGSVWAKQYAEARLSKQGLRAYAQHPLLRTVSLDRAFYRPLDASQYAAYAAQVPEDFRFVVKAPSLVADAMVRSEDGRGMRLNSAFLDADLAVREYARPALEGLRKRLGALVFQLSPVPPSMLRQLPDLLRRLATMLSALPPVREVAPEAVVAVEVRDPEFLSSALVEVLKQSGATYCLGLHAKMPPIQEQLPILRGLWPGPLVCRWNLHRKHGAYGYEDARRLYGNFDRLVDPDPETREQLAKVIAGTTAAGYPAYVTIGNKAEGSAPLSAIALAQAVDAFRTSSPRGG